MLLCAFKCFYVLLGAFMCMLAVGGLMFYKTSIKVTRHDIDFNENDLAQELKYNLPRNL